MGPVRHFTVAASQTRRLSQSIGESERARGNSSDSAFDRDLHNDAMKYLRLTCLALAARMTLAACHGRRQRFDLGHADSMTPPPQRGDVVSGPPALVATYSPSDLLALLGGNDLGKTFLQLAYTPLCTISVYHMNYETVDPGGNLTVGRGRPDGSRAERQPLHGWPAHRPVRPRNHDVDDLRHQPDRHHR